MEIQFGNIFKSLLLTFGPAESFSSSVSLRSHQLLSSSGRGKTCVRRHAVDPSGSPTSEDQEEDEDHNHDGNQDPDGAPLPAT